MHSLHDAHKVNTISVDRVSPFVCLNLRTAGWILIKFIMGVTELEVTQVIHLISYN
jgi:hypothetical protein